MTTYTQPATCNHRAGWCALQHGEECRQFRAAWGPPEHDDGPDEDSYADDRAADRAADAYERRLFADRRRA